MNTDLSHYDNSWYNQGKGGFIRIVWYFINVLFFINPLNPFSCIKVRLLRLFGAKIGKGVVIKPKVNIKYPWRLEVGNYTWIGENAWIDNLANVKIGNNVCISQGAMLLCGNHWKYHIGKRHLDWGTLHCLSWCYFALAFCLRSGFGCQSRHGILFYLSRKSC